MLCAAGALINESGEIQRLVESIYRCWPFSVRQKAFMASNGNAEMQKKTNVYACDIVGDLDNSTEGNPLRNCVDRQDDRDKCA